MAAGDLLAVSKLYSAMKIKSESQFAAFLSVVACEVRF